MNNHFRFDRISMTFPLKFLECMASDGAKSTLCVVEKIPEEEIGDDGEMFISQEGHEFHVRTDFSRTKNNFYFRTLLENFEKSIDVGWFVLKITIHKYENVGLVPHGFFGSSFHAFSFS